VIILNKVSNLDVNDDGTPRKVPTRDHVTSLRNRSITLGGTNKDLNLVILLPKQDARSKVRGRDVFVIWT
jgi:hypothetical protein